MVEGALAYNAGSHQYPVIVKTQKLTCVALHSLVQHTNANSILYQWIGLGSLVVDHPTFYRIFLQALTYAELLYLNASSESCPKLPVVQSCDSCNRV